jgi:hypothetical protein
LRTDVSGRASPDGHTVTKPGASGSIAVIVNAAAVAPSGTPHSSPTTVTAISPPAATPRGRVSTSRQGAIATNRDGGVVAAGRSAAAATGAERIAATEANRTATVTAMAPRRPVDAGRTRPRRRLTSAVSRRTGVEVAGASM